MKKFLPKLPKLSLPKTPTLPVVPTAGLFDPVKELGDGLLSQVTRGIDSSVGLVTTTLGSVPFIGSSETSDDYDHTQTDEKHYFLVPDPVQESGFTVHIMRCLPVGVPPINDLPKRRLVHLPSAHALPMLQETLMTKARHTARSQSDSPSFIKGNIDSFVEEIDKVDDKMFNGVILVGGLIALVNPLAGATVALKAMVPSVGLIVSKYGLKLAGETMTNADISNRIRKAENDVKAQFKAGRCIRIINPMLRQVAHLNEANYHLNSVTDLQFITDDITLSPADRRRLVKLTEQAVINACGPSAEAMASSLSRVILSDIKDTT